MDSCRTTNLITALGIGSHTRRLKVLHELSQPQPLPYETKLLLDSIVRCDDSLRIICAVEVPGIEAGEVLYSSEDLVAAHYGRKETLILLQHIGGWRGVRWRRYGKRKLTCCCDEAEVVGDGGVVDEGIGDHREALLSP